MNDKEHVQKEVEFFGDSLKELKNEIQKFIVGQTDVVEGTITCLLSAGHVLLEGVPGLGKTMLVTTLAKALELPFSRIQFTPDLMPADILGTNMILEKDGEKQFSFQKGPVFTNILLADEINRATPKTQSALLEAMQEKIVTVGNKTYDLPAPFMVLATQNPLEMEGTYPLPEAQVDRFMFKLIVPFPSKDELHKIMERTTGAGDIKISPVLSGEKILRMRTLVRAMPVPSNVQDYALRILSSTHPDNPETPKDIKRYVRFGGSPRAAQAILLAGRVRALSEGRYSLSYEDIKSVVKPALRHRMIMNFEAEAEGIRADDLLDLILKNTRTEK
ncbi:MAG: MoxR family ATPase [Deltaproteobacteria bacterium]|nr:MoxR family ATPase [Deltaproteobacteria bacterium]